MIPYMKATGLKDGINFSYGGNVGNTFNSHRLVALAKTKGNEMQNKVIEEIFKCYFEKEGDITLDHVLVQCGTSAGLDS